MVFLFKIYAAIFGALIGSFLNVLIYRLPRDIDIKIKRSNCPHCQVKIAWFFNIPLFSFIWLKGKCHNCSAAISFRYPLVELITCLVSWALFPSILTVGNLAVYSFFFSIFCCLLVHFFIDLEHKILPNSINLYLGALFLAFAVVTFSWQHWLLGAIIGGGGPLLITWGYYKLRGKIGLGGGDIKLFTVLGIYLGVEGVLRNIFFSCFLGALIGGGLILAKRMASDNPLPFGPFIIFVASIQIFFPVSFSQLMQFIF